jgi:hypothetical protein
MNYENFIIGLFDKGEWQAILITLALTFAITYSIKMFYCAFVDNAKKLKMYVRLIAINAGMIAAALSWPDDTISMKWYAAGAIIGPLSILVYHLLIGIVSMKVIHDKFPFLKTIVKGA